MKNCNTLLFMVQISQVVYSNVGGFSNYVPDDSNDALLTTAMVFSKSLLCENFGAFRHNGDI
jgi:hypothetical protein